MSRVYNFSAGPAVLPEEVLKECADEMMDYKGCGMSVMEMSHRSKVYDEIIKELVLLADPADRMPLLHEQEEILMRDMPILPIFFDTSPMMVNCRLKGYLHLTTGGLDFKKAYLE